MIIIEEQKIIIKRLEVYLQHLEKWSISEDPHIDDEDCKKLKARIEKIRNDLNKLKSKIEWLEFSILLEVKVNDSILADREILLQQYN